MDAQVNGVPYTGKCSWYGNFTGFTVTEATVKIQSMKNFMLVIKTGVMYQDMLTLLHKHVTFAAKMMTTTFIHSMQLARYIAIILSYSNIHGYLESPYGVVETMNYRHKAQIGWTMQVTLQKEIITVVHAPRMTTVSCISHCINSCHSKHYF